MKAKLLVAVTSIFLIACGANNNKTAKKTQPPSSLAQESKPDYHKAALLNVQLGEGYLAQGQIARAKQKFLHALELQPRLPEAHTSIGYFYESVSDIGEAEDHYKKAISYAENKGRFYNNYGTFLCRQGRYKEADKAFNSAIKDKNYINTAEVYENAGKCALKEPDNEKARFYLQTSIKRDPNRPGAYLELANIEFERGSYLLAKDYLEHYKQLTEPTAKSLWLSIRVNKALGDKKSLLGSADQLRQKFPNSEQYKQYLESFANE